MSFYERVKDLCEHSGFTISAISQNIPNLEVTKSSVGHWKKGAQPRPDKVKAISDYFGVSMEWLLTGEEKQDTKPNIPNPKPPQLTEDFTTFPVIGEVAAGYDFPAIENWEGDTVDIPNSYLKGHEKTDFFVLRVIGSSMLPKYEEGDKVLVLRQSTMNYSGQIGVVLYDEDYATLKRIEYKPGEDWMRLVPLNPLYETVKITDADLEKCRVLGVPKLLIREIED